MHMCLSASISELLSCEYHRRALQNSETLAEHKEKENRLACVHLEHKKSPKGNQCLTHTCSNIITVA